ncbi:MAG TPA: PIN domain-containing protein [Polyangiales bacterium]|nr:PIN domain-containing protein [Polyangiales bacterium]
MNGLTLDTGALIALERKDQRTSALIAIAHRKQQVITVPAPVVVEWWRGQRGPVANLLDALVVEPLTLPLARLAGAALGACASGPSTTDAVVMASAAQRGDAVLTGDFADLQKLQTVFTSVRLLGV